MQPTILLVDDEQDILDFLSYSLKKEGYRVFTALNGVEGIKLAKEVQPSLIIMDVMMPEMDGIEACQQIREETKIKQPIITFLTSQSLIRPLLTNSNILRIDKLYSLMKSFNAED